VKKNTIGKFKYYSLGQIDSYNDQKIVMIYHGWGGSAEGCVDVADELFEAGYSVIVPEIMYHDTRQKLDHPFDRAVMQEYFWKTIIESIEEFDEFVSALGIDKEDIILVGSSMGGFIANGIFAREPKLHGLANINGSGSFVLSEHLFRKMDNREPLSQEEEQVLKNYDPFERTASSSPILLLHGGRDEIIPIEGQKNYYDYLTLVEKRTNVVFKVYEGVNHEFAEEMVEDLVEWLKNIGG
jgi:uncharacterized protein